MYADLALGKAFPKTDLIFFLYNFFINYAHQVSAVLPWSRAGYYLLASIETAPTGPS